MAFIDPATGKPAKAPDAAGMASRLRSAREYAGLTQQQFATRIGYSRRQILAWENGTNAPPVWLLAAVREVFDVDPEWILCGPGSVPLRKIPLESPDRRQRIHDDIRKLANNFGLKLPEAALQYFADLVAKEPEEAEIAAKLRVEEAFRILSHGGTSDGR
ncbi:helix-turn-helix transcriptional regulator [Sphingomonas abietis]|uniref:Helix-turn-helix domain-containing protein n=1 Tax=Sphingomonas abietis TaxID=3012344 RepID=A0ABY7NPK4_9SPHN|nr:helix-turn-helix domain-containing protein [Sphingomonas abietis]WBO22507.1 helix-turn-helix domain-containing protein [Sphingomonas abietis]